MKNIYLVTTHETFIVKKMYHVHATSVDNAKHILLTDEVDADYVALDGSVIQAQVINSFINSFESVTPVYMYPNNPK